MVCVCVLEGEREGRREGGRGEGGGGVGERRERREGGEERRGREGGREEGARSEGGVRREGWGRGGREGGREGGGGGRKRGERGSTVYFLFSQHSHSETERETKLVEFIKSYVRLYMRPENPSPILVYGDATPESKSHSKWLAKRLSVIQHERKSLSTYSTDQVTVSVEEPGFDYFHHFCLTIADHTKEIWTLECSYEEFVSEYPFLCGDVDFMAMDPLPHRINKHIFLGKKFLVFLVMIFNIDDSGVMDEERAGETDFHRNQTQDQCLEIQCTNH